MNFLKLQIDNKAELFYNPNRNAEARHGDNISYVIR